MPYLDCEQCGTRVYSAARRGRAEECPVCGSALPQRQPPQAAQPERSGALRSTREVIFKQIEDRLGRIPAFFEPASAKPDVLQELWRQTRLAWLESPVPASFRLDLVDLLAAHSPWPWATVAEAAGAAVLERPALQVETIIDAARNKTPPTGRATKLPDWPEPGTTERDELLALTLRLVLDAGDYESRDRLLARLGEERFASLIAVLTYLQTCRTFAQLHPGLVAASGAEFRQETEPQSSHTSDPAHLAFEGAPLGIALVTVDPGGPGAIAKANRAMAVLTGRSESELVGLALADISDPDDLDLDAELMSQLLVGQIPSYDVSKRFRRADGQSFRADLSVSLIRADDDERTPLYLVIQLVDVSERKRVDEALLAHRDRLAGVFEEAPTGMGLASLDGRWLQVNDAFCQILSYDEAELLAKCLWDLVAPDEVETIKSYLRQVMAGEVLGYQIETRAVTANDELVWVQLGVSLVHDYDGTPAHVFVEIQDVSERKRLEAELEQGALLDASTGLPSRALLFDRLEQARARRGRTGTRFVVMFAAVFGLDAVAAELGRDGAHAALGKIAERIVASVRSSDTVSRYGSDEIVVVCEDLESEGDAEVIASRILDVAPFTVGEHGTAIELGVAVGMTVAASDSDSSATLVERAEAAMHIATRADGDFHEYSDSM